MQSFAAQPPPKEWKGGNGNATTDEKWVNNAKPGNSDVAKIANGKVTLNDPLTVDALEFTGGVIDGSGTLTLLGLTQGSIWTGGEITGATVVTSGATIGGGTTKKLSNSAQLNLGGATTWTGDNIGTGSNSKINNSGTFTTNFDGKIGHDGGDRGTFKNDGTFTKSHGSASATEIESIFNNNGTVNVNAGTLKLSGGGSSNNAVNVANSAKLQLGGNDYAFTGGTLNGAGMIDVNSFTTTFSGTSGSANLSVTGGTAKFSGNHSTSGALTVASGVVDGASTATATVGDFVWNGGDIKTTKVNSSGAATIGTGGAKKLIDGAQLTFGGATTWDGSTISTGGSSVITNQSGATFSASADGTIAHDVDANRATFTNEGTFRKSGGTGTAEVQTKFDSTGSIVIDANMGTLKLSGGGKSTGGVSVGNGAKVQIGTSNYAFENGALNGAGTIELNGATTTFKGTTGSANIAVNGGTAKFDTTHQSSGKFTLSSGDVTGLGNATFGNLEWSGGSLNAHLTSNGATIGSGGNKHLSTGGKLTLLGDTTWDGSSILTGGGATIDNKGNFAAGDGTIGHDGTARATFKNAGSFLKGGAGVTDLQTLFDNSGAVHVNNGRLKLSGGGQGRANSSIAVAAGAQLDIDGDLTLDSTSELKGKGLARLLNGALTADGLLAIENFDLLGGQLRGSHTFGGTVNWHGGDWNAIGPGAITTIGTSATLNIGNGGIHSFNFRQVINNGVINWQSGDLRAGNGAILYNAGLFNDLNTGSVSISTNGFSGAFSFTNQGAYNKSGAGTTKVEVAFANNSGGIVVSAGTLHFANSYTQTGGALVIQAGASARFDMGLNLGGGVLSGSGTVQGNVTSGGFFSPGSSPGTMTVTGNLTLLSTSTLLIELGGTTQGVTYDLINVSGAAVVAGNLSVSFVNGFQGSILPTDTFTVLTANGPGGLTGLFTNVANGGRIDALGGGSFQVNLGANSLVLSNFSPIPEPSTYALLGMGALAVIAGLRRRRR